MRISDWSSDVCSSDLAAVAPPCPEWRDDLWRADAVLGHLCRPCAAKLWLRFARDRPDRAGRRRRRRGRVIRRAMGRRWTLSPDPARRRDTDARRIWLPVAGRGDARSEEPTSELQSLMRISYAVFCLNKTKHT